MLRTELDQNLNNSAYTKHSQTPFSLKLTKCLPNKTETSPVYQFPINWCSPWLGRASPLRQIRVRKSAIKLRATRCPHKCSSTKQIWTRNNISNSMKWKVKNIINTSIKTTPSKPVSSQIKTSRIVLSSTRWTSSAILSFRSLMRTRRWPRTLKTRLQKYSPSSIFRRYAKLQTWQFRTIHKHLDQPNNLKLSEEWCLPSRRRGRKKSWTSCTSSSSRATRPSSSYAWTWIRAKEWNNTSNSKHNRRQTNLQLQLYLNTYLLNKRRKNPTCSQNKTPHMMKT